MKRAASENGQVGTAARRFALIAVAGNLATTAGVTGWGRTEDGESEAEWAAHRCFRAWLSERGTVGNVEDQQAVRQLSDFVARHGNARFEYWPVKEIDPADQSGDTEMPLREGRTVMNRAGWRRPVGDPQDNDRRYEFFFTAAGMREALDGLNFKSAIKLLAQRDFIKAGPIEIAQSLKPPGAGKQRLYVVLPHVMSAGLDDPSPFEGMET